MLEMPSLETPRLIIRPFVLSDLDDAHRLFDLELDAEDLHTENVGTVQGRLAWLQWVVQNYQQLAKLNQPPYGDRAIELKQNGLLIGSCGYVPCLAPFDQLSPGSDSGSPGRFSPEFGLFYAISPQHQRNGYASEAALALVDYAFQTLKIKRVVATTDYDNEGSIGVMKKIGMRIERNHLQEPWWFQVVGVLDCPPQLKRQQR